jgi:hypothetical protein
MRKLFLAAAIAAAAFAAGCGKDTKQDDASFRIPDSLLSEIESFRLTVDDYHVVKGGVMANAQIELRYPAAEASRFVAVKSFGFLKRAYEVVSKEIGRPAAGKLVVIGTADLDEYKLMTRKEWWYYGVVKGDTIIFEPLDIMIKRMIAEPGIANRVAQAAVNRRSGGRSPAWLREAVASRIANEAEILKIQMPEFEHEGRVMDPSPERIEEAIAEGAERGDSRVAYYAAYRMLENLLARHSMNNVLSFFDRLREGKTLDEASVGAFGVSYATLIDAIRVDG